MAVLSACLYGDDKKPGGNIYTIRKLSLSTLKVDKN